jgi:Domain of unknown function (DUF397)
VTSDNATPLLPQDQASASIPDAKWKKSSLSMSNGSCVEVANLPGYVGVRDSKDRNGPVLLFTPDEWNVFIRGVRSDKFDAAP